MTRKTPAAEAFDDAMYEAGVVREVRRVLRWAESIDIENMGPLMDLRRALEALDDARLDALDSARRVTT